MCNKQTSQITFIEVKRNWQKRNSASLISSKILCNFQIWNSPSKKSASIENGLAALINRSDFILCLIQTRRWRSAHSYICKERASEPRRTRGSQVLSFAPCPSLKVTCFPVVHCLKKEVEWWGGRWGSELLCKAIILFTSRCMYKEWRRQDGNVREMSNACRPCPVYFTEWNVHSGEEGTDQGGGVGARSHLLMTKQNRRWSYTRQVWVNGCGEGGQALILQEQTGRGIVWITLEK